jgi:GAF domain-containing protein
MKKRLETIFAPQELRDRDAVALYQILNSVVLVGLAATLVALIAGLAFHYTAHVITATAILAVLMLTSYIFLRYRILLPAQVLLPLSLYAASTYFVMIGIGLHDVVILAFAAIVIITSLLLGNRASIVMAGLIIVTAFTVWWLDTSGIAPTEAGSLNAPDDPFLFAILIAGITAAQSALINRLSQSAQQARDNEQSQIAINKELLELKETLGQRVTERTAELEQVNRLSAHRAASFEAVARVSRTITSAQGLQVLLPHIAEVISAEFGFYHTGIFLNDEAAQYAVLVAGNSAGGKRMLERGHKLKIGEQGIVGAVTGSGAPRISLDVGKDAIYFDNPDMPATRSEMALPLKVAGKTIGALDIQSTEPSAFSNEDIASLSILADQVSIAIENARLYESTRKSLEQAEAAYRRFVKGEWQRLIQEEDVVGYRYVSGITTPLSRPIDIGEGSRVFEDGKIYHQDGSQNQDAAELTVPVKLRGEVIGVLNISIPGRDQWLDDEIDIAEAVSERLALSVENARLFQTANTRAERERIISDISSKLSGTIHMQNLLQIAAQEIGQALNGSEVLIQIQSAEPAGGPE